MEKWVLEMCVCPVCKGPLEYRRSANLLVCRFDRLGYEVHDGVPNFVPELAQHLTAKDVEDGARS